MKSETLFMSGVGAVLLPVFQYFYGEGEAVTTAMAALLFFIVLDWITGVQAAKKDKTYGSKYGLDGIARTFFILLLPAGGHFLDNWFNLPAVIFGALSLGILYHIIQSMTANAIRAGWGDYFPEWMLTRIMNWVKSELDQKVQRSVLRKVNDELVQANAVIVTPVATETEVVSEEGK